MISKANLILAGMLGLCGAGLAESAIPPKLIQATPRSVVAALYLEGRSGEQADHTAAELIAAVLSRGGVMGLFGELNDTERITLDLLTCWPVIRRYPRAYLLHDIKLRRLPTGGNRLDGLALSLVLQTGEHRVEIQRLVQQLLSKYTNDQSGHLEQITIGGRPFHRLTDSSLPSWVVWEWGQYEDTFIVSVGAGSCEKVIRALSESASSIAGEEWFSTAQQRCQANAAGFELFIDAGLLQERLGDSARDRFHAVVESLGLHAARKSLWTVGSSGRAYSCYAYHQDDTGESFEQLSEPASYRPDHQRLVPEGASGYAIFQTSGAALLRRIRSCYLASQRLEKRVELLAGWERLARERKVNFERDVLGQLGEFVIVHNHPRHPFGLPLMWTVLIEIKGDAKRVERTVSQVLSYCEEKLDAAASRKDAGFIRPLLRRTPSGIWYVQYGLSGPAVAVTDGWLVISYSPEALRLNLAAAPAGKSVRVLRSAGSSGSQPGR